VLIPALRCFISYLGKRFCSPTNTPISATPLVDHSMMPGQWQRLRLPTAPLSALCPRFCPPLTILSACSTPLSAFQIVGEVELFGPLSRSIRSIKRRLFTIIITRIDRKLRDKFIKSN
jgi:hypothetical protein